MKRLVVVAALMMAMGMARCGSESSPESVDSKVEDTSEPDTASHDVASDVPEEDLAETDLTVPDQTVPDQTVPDVEPDEVEPGCGDGVCGANEDPCTCPADCLVEGELGEETCCEDSDCLQASCGPCCAVMCVDFKCTAPVTQESCCWNGMCEEGETFETCPEDCPEPYCGNGVCDGDETPCSCGQDCLGDGNACCVDSDCPPLNCGPCCVLTCVEYQCASEPTWLKDCCFNNSCEPGESSANCPVDCSCGNGTCDAGEDTVNCDQDCDKPANVDPSCSLENPISCGTATGRATVLVDSGMPAPSVSQPYAGVLVEAISNGVVVAASLTAEVGDYELLLSPGEWLIRATPPAAEDMWDEVYPANIEKTVTIVAGEKAINDFEFIYSGIVVDKPNIYLYPEETQNVSVKLAFNPGEFVTVSIPQYGNGWSVTAQPDGLLDGTYGYLFYEAAVGDGWQMEAGHVVAASELEEWMYSMLPAYGLNAQETFDFADFWKDALPKANWYTFYPQYDDLISQHVGLKVQPAPDSVLRLWFVVVPSDAPAFPEAPVIAPFERSGFAVVEWGVIISDAQ